MLETEQGKQFMKTNQKGGNFQITLEKKGAKKKNYYGIRKRYKINVKWANNL